MHNKLWNIGWGTVSMCNMRCEFCYSRSHRNSTKDLGIKEWILFIDENWRYINSINYGTGENSLSDDWFVLIDYIRKNYPHIRQAITTNGYIGHIVNLDSEKRNIVIHSIDEMDVSLDFADPKKHNKFRGQPYAYEWAIEALEFCQQNNIPSTVVCLGSAVNAYVENLEGIFRVAEKHNSIVRMNLYRPTEGVNAFSKRFIISPEAVLSLLSWVNMNHTILSISDALYSSQLTDNFECDPSGFNSLRILPNGDISPSTYLIQDRFIVGNICESKILEQITNNNVFNKIVKETIPDECIECRYVKECKGGVYDRRYLWHGTLSKKDPYCCYKPGSPELEKVSISNKEFRSVHHGYLPTMFFLPGKMSDNL